MKEGETIESIIEGQIRLIDSLRERNRLEGIRSYEIDEILAGFRLFLQDLSACELSAYNPYEIHPQKQYFFPCLYRVIIAKDLAQYKSDKLNVQLRKRANDE